MCVCLCTHIQRSLCHGHLYHPRALSSIISATAIRLKLNDTMSSAKPAVYLNASPKRAGSVAVALHMDELCTDATHATAMSDVRKAMRSNGMGHHTVGCIFVFIRPTKTSATSDAITATTEKPAATCMRCARASQP